MEGVCIAPSEEESHCIIAAGACSQPAVERVHADLPLILIIAEITHVKLKALRVIAELASR